MDFVLPETFFRDVFEPRLSEMAVTLEHALITKVGNQVVVSTSELSLFEYEQLGLCAVELQNSPRPILTRYWGGEDKDRLFSNFEQALWQVTWRGNRLAVLMASWNTSCGRNRRYWVISDNSDLANDFILDVARQTNDPGRAILVFRNGYWQRSGDLYENVQQSNFDDLILDESLKQSIRSDFQRFIGTRQHYEELGVAWRRGALLIGPPGNGKTHCVRALIKDLAIPSLYVQSLSHRYYENEELLQKVFTRARELRPCMLIFEDLDALVNKENQSFFLNQLDGFEKNVGLIVLATTNHPEKIDPAIIDRPSRFDRKYHFGLPRAHHRQLFLHDWQAKLSNQVDWSVESIEVLVGETEGFSFAYLKELVVSGLLTWLADQSLPFEEQILTQCKLLSNQMETYRASATEII